MKINPYFEVNGKTYEIKRTRFLESEYEKITKASPLTAEQESMFADYIKLEGEYTEIVQKFKEAKDAYFDDVTDEKKKAVYQAFKELNDEKYNEMKNFELSRPSFSLRDMQEQAYNNGVKLLYIALKEQYGLTEEKAIAVWDNFVEHFGKQTSMEWILVMVQSLFSNDEDEQDPFLAQARAKAQQRMEQRKGLAKIKK